MGKRNIIKTLINSIALVAYHKILYEKGKKPEAKKHLTDELRDCSTNGFEKAQGSNLNEDELKEIEEKSIKRTTNVLRNKYPDIEFSEQKIKEKVIDTMQEFLLK